MSHQSTSRLDANANSSASEHPPLVGREREQGILHAWLEAAGAGQGRCILISGESGIGKTSLATEIAVEAAMIGALVLWGHAYDLTITPPYGPWIELARRYTPTDDLPAFPAFLDDRNALAAVGSQDALFAQAWDFFATLAAHRPVVLILEDLHWADPESLSLLRFVARQVDRSRVLVLVTYRSDELTRRHPLYQLVPLLVREAHATRLELHPLDDFAIRELITQRYPLADADVARLETYLAEHAEGNPLFAGELLRTLEDDRVLSWRAEGWTLGDLSRVRLPPLLLQVIEGRLGRLSEATRRLLESAAVIGQEVPLDLWQRLSEADEETLAIATVEGFDTHLLLESASGTLRFSHALVREALYQGIVLVRRRSWHRMVGETLVASSSPDPDAVAYHFTRAGDVRAGEWLVRAGERAQRAYSWMTAAERFEAALSRLTEQGAPPSERAVLLNHIAMLLRYVDARRALERMEEARTLAEVANEPGLASVCRFRAGWMHCLMGDIRVGLVAMEQGTKTFEALDAAAQARCQSLLKASPSVDLPTGLLVNWLASAGHLDKARSRGRRIVAELSAPELRLGQGVVGLPMVVLGLGEVEALLGRPDASRTLYQQARASFQSIEHYEYLALAYEAELAQVQIPYSSDNLEERKWLAQKAEESGLWAQGANPPRPARFRVVPQLILDGIWTEARDIASRTYGSGSWAGRASAAWWLALVARDQGDAALTWRIVAETLPDGPSTEPGDAFIWAALPLQRLAAEVSLGAGNLQTARSWLEAHDRWLAWSGAVLGRAEGALGWAQFHHANGDPRQAGASAEQALAHASEPRQPLALIAIHRFLGILDTEAKRFDAAEDHLRQSLRLATACAAPFERALTLLGLAELRLTQRQSEEVRALLAEVRAICEPLEAKPTLARVDALEQRLTTAQPTRPPRYPAGLTAREVEVLRLLIQGLSNPDIADRLFLSRRTVDTHLSAIYRKLDVNTRTAAAHFAVVHDLT